MKLKNRMEELAATIGDNKEAILKHKEWLKTDTAVKDHVKRLVWDVLRSLKGTNWICGLYREEGANDTHIETLGRKCLQDAGLI